MEVVTKVRRASLNLHSPKHEVLNAVQNTTTHVKVHQIDMNWLLNIGACAQIFGTRTHTTSPPRTGPSGSHWVGGVLIQLQSFKERKRIPFLKLLGNVQTVRFANRPIPNISTM